MLYHISVIVDKLYVNETLQRTICRPFTTLRPGCTPPPRPLAVNEGPLLPMKNCLLLMMTDAGVSVSSCSTSRLNITTQSHLATNRASDACSTSAAAAVATMPVIPFPGAFPAGFCGLSPAQLAPLQMYPPYIFMGFPLHPQLLQSYQVPTAEPLATYPSVNPAKRKSTQPMRAPRDEKMYRGSHTPTPTLQSVGHVAYLPIVTSPPAHDESRDRKHYVMTSSVDSRQGAREFDQDGALDLTKK